MNNSWKTYEIWRELTIFFAFEQVKGKINEEML